MNPLAWFDSLLVLRDNEQRVFIEDFKSRWCVKHIIVSPILPELAMTVRTHEIIIFNRFFWDMLTEKEREFILLHEVRHIYEYNKQGFGVWVMEFIAIGCTMCLGVFFPISLHIIGKYKERSKQIEVVCDRFAKEQMDFTEQEYINMLELLRIH